MRRRIVTFLVIFAGLVGGASGAQALGANRPQAAGYWGCAGVRVVDVGLCVENPLPDRLPIPATPAL